MKAEVKVISAPPPSATERDEATGRIFGRLAQTMINMQRLTFVAADQDGDLKDATLAAIEALARNGGALADRAAVAFQWTPIQDIEGWTLDSDLADIEILLAPTTTLNEGAA